MEEIWKQIIGSYDGEVSSLGRIKRNGKIITPYYDPEGYPRCTVGGRGRERVHIFVAEAFIPNPNNLPLVDHKDKVKTNCRANNLQYVNYSDNAKNAVYSKPRKEPIIGINIKTNEKRQFNTQTEAGKYIGISNPSHSGEINKVLKGKRKTTHNWKFYYASEYIERDMI